MIAVIDYNAGNIRSVLYALERIGVEHVLTKDHDVIRAADKVIFPGVGAAESTMKHLNETGLTELIRSLKQPVFGICVGMQLICSHSEEGDVPCIGVFPERVKRFRPTNGDKVPHMGWNQVQQVNDHPLWARIDDNSRFYFVHSYCATGVPDEQMAGRCEYGLAFAAAVAKRNVFAVQFHPEKSADAGLKLLENFLRWQP